MPGSIETLPAGFRLNTMSIPHSMTAVPKKQLQPEGRAGGRGWIEFSISTLHFNDGGTVLTTSAFASGNRMLSYNTNNKNMYAVNACVKRDMGP